MVCGVVCGVWCMCVVCVCVVCVWMCEFLCFPAHGMFSTPFRDRRTDCFGVNYINTSQANLTLRSDPSSTGYSPNIDCTWLVVAPNGFVPTLNVNYLDILNANPLLCVNDSLTVQPGVNASRRSYCGNYPAFTISSADRYMWVQFHSEYAAVLSARAGFSAYVTFAAGKFVGIRRE